MKSSYRIYLLIAAAMSFMIVIGGGVYEHMNIVPKWKLAPPASLTMFQGEYGINPGNFWQLIHPVTLILLIAALIANWKTVRRKYILINITGYAIILIITFTYFVPELLAIIQTPYEPAANNDLVSKAGLWEKLSLARLVFMIVIAVILLRGLTKGNESVTG